MRKLGFIFGLLSLFVFTAVGQEKLLPPGKHCDETYNEIKLSGNLSASIQVFYGEQDIKVKLPANLGIITLRIEGRSCIEHLQQIDTSVGQEWCFDISRFDRGDYEISLSNSNNEQLTGNFFMDP